MNASYWIIAVALWYVRSLALLAIRGAHPREVWWDTVFSLGLLATIDALLVVRFYSYVTFLKNRPKGPTAVA